MIKDIWAQEEPGDFLSRLPALAERLGVKEINKEEDHSTTILLITGKTQQEYDLFDILEKLIERIENLEARR